VVYFICRTRISFHNMIIIGVGASILKDLYGNTITVFWVNAFWLYAYHVLFYQAPNQRNRNLTRWTRGRSLHSHTIPYQAYVQYVLIPDHVSPFKYLRGGVEFLNAIPKSQAGKILHQQLRQRMAQSKI